MWKMFKWLIKKKNVTRNFHDFLSMVRLKHVSYYIKFSGLKPKVKFKI